MTVPSGPKVSIIVTAFNNSDTIVECLDSLVNQTYPNKEIIVVCDTSSTDDTLEKVEKYKKLHNEIKILFCYRFSQTEDTRSRARNIGWRNTSSPVVMFADGDDLYGKEFISRAVETLQSSSVYGGVCLGGEALQHDDSLLSKYYSSFGPTDRRIVNKEDPDWAEVYKLECLKRTGGFDERLSQGEDKELCSRVKKLGYRIAYVEGVNWYHRKPTSVRCFLKKEYLAGRRRISYELKQRKIGALLSGIAPFAAIVTVILLAVLYNVFLASTVFLVAVFGYGLYLMLRRKKNASSPSLLIFIFIVGLLAKASYSLGKVTGIFYMLFDNYNSKQ